MTLEAASVEQLKAMAYDQLVALQTAQNNLTVLNKAIESKLSQQPKEAIDGNNTSDNSGSQGSVSSDSGVCSSETSL